jgi:hypothetical protein
MNGPERVSEDATGPGPGRIDSFLRELVGAAPGLRYSEIARTTCEALGVAEVTVFRHLTRLIRYGELVVSPRRTYSVPAKPVSTSRAAESTRWYGTTIVLDAEGNMHDFTEREFRVVAGQLDHLEFNFVEPPSQFNLWCSHPSRVVEVPGSKTPSHRTMYRLEFQPPLRARDPEWTRYAGQVSLPRWYRMSSDPSVPSPAEHAGRRGRWETCTIQVPRYLPRFERILPDNARLFLQVVLPWGYPIGPVVSQVRFLSDERRVDEIESRRLDSLKGEAAGAGGFHRSGNVLSLAVPKPLSDRVYEIAWQLPTVARRERWLASTRPPSSGNAPPHSPPRAHQRDTRP